MPHGLGLSSLKTLEKLNKYKDKEGREGVGNQTSLWVVCKLYFLCLGSTSLQGHVLPIRIARNKRHPVKTTLVRSVRGSGLDTTGCRFLF